MTRQRNTTSATVGKGTESMLKGSKLRLVWLHWGQVTELRVWPIAVSVIKDRLRRRNLCDDDGGK